MACTDQAMAECVLRQACSYEDFSVVRVYGDLATCVAQGAVVCINNLHVLDIGQTPDHIESCAQSYANDSCSDFFDGNLPQRCAIPAGPGAIGSPCSAQAQCASTFCAVPDHEICGTCQVLPDLGAPCATGADCGRGIACPIPSGATMGVCTAYANDGMACLTGTVPCVSTEICVGDNTATGVMGICKPAVRQVGAACDTARKAPSCDATYGLACIVTTTGSTAGTCQPIQFAEASEPCGTIGTGTAKTSVTCTRNGTCVKTPATAAMGVCVGAISIGGACTPDGALCIPPADCLVGADGVSGTCTVTDPAECF